jgi:hypothetical protein
MVCSIPLIALALLAAPLDEEPHSVAFFYGAQAPISRLARFDWVVVQPDNLSATELAKLHQAGAEVFAYMSLGETSPGSVDSKQILGRNDAWNSVIVDPSSEGWHNHILARVAALRRSGYRALFLDTLDSYAMVPGHGEKHRAGLAKLIASIHERHPEVKLLFNRGFEILPEVGHLACGVVAESLLFGWDAASKRYVDVAPPARDWLRTKLEQVAKQLSIPIVVVDYLPESRSEDARAAARRILAMGFLPWISTPGLDTFGVGATEATAEPVLLIHDGAEPASPLLDSIASTLDGLGFVPERVDVRKGLPVPSPTATVTLFTDDELPAALGYPQWLARQIEAGGRVAMLGRPGFAASQSFLTRLGLATVAESSRVVRIVSRDSLIGFESEPRLRSRDLVRWRANSPDAVVHLRVEDDGGRVIDPVLTAPWGGLALQPYLFETGYQGRVRWISDPSAFLARALRVSCHPHGPHLCKSARRAEGGPLR